MRLEIRQTGIKITDELRAHVTERLEAALGRFDPSIECVRVYLCDVNGPRGGLGERCQITVELWRRGSVVVTGIAPDIFAAVTQTASRARFAVRRSLKQRLSRRRLARRVQSVG